MLCLLYNLSSVSLTAVTLIKISVQVVKSLLIFPYNKVGNSMRDFGIRILL